MNKFISNFQALIKVLEYIGFYRRTDPWTGSTLISRARAKSGVSKLWRLLWVPFWITCTWSSGVDFGSTLLDIGVRHLRSLCREINVRMFGPIEKKPAVGGPHPVQFWSWLLQCAGSFVNRSVAPLRSLFLFYFFFFFAV